MRALIFTGVLMVSAFGQPSPLPDAPDDVQTFVKQALEDRLAANNIPDLNLLGSARRIAIRQDMPRAHMNLNAEAAPHVDGYEFYFSSSTDLQAQADRTGHDIFFILVDEPSIDGEIAAISLGLDVDIPAGSKRVKLCCCVSKGQFHKAAAWTFLKWLGGVCS